MTEIQAVVMGRVNADLYPAPSELRKPLSQIDHFDRYVGGFAGNVATGLARLGVRVGIASRVGDDGHGRFVGAWLAEQGVDVRWLVTDPEYGTAITFCEVWPPDRFPITFYRHPTCPDWRLSPSDLDLDEIAEIPVLLASGTGLARSPSLETTMEALRRHRGTTILDLDHRPSLWIDPEDYPVRIRPAAREASIVIGNSDELTAATGVGDERAAAQALLALGPSLVAVKRGHRGSAVHDAAGVREVEGYEVEVVNGLGAGDAFAAAFASGLLAGVPAAEAARLGNAAGAMVAAAIPCSAAMPTMDELREFAGSRVTA